MELVWDEIYENQRWALRKDNNNQNWQACPQIRLDPPQWTNKTYQKLPSIYDHRLPSSENEHLRWVWVDEWTVEKGAHTDTHGWQYAISHGATLGSFKFKKKRAKKHFVRQRKWRRPRIRKIEIGTTEINETVIENQRIMIKSWKSPYFPGDPPHYSDKNGHLCTMKQIESRLPPSWLWQTDWTVEKGPHTDSKGWEYAADFHVGQWRNKYTPVLNSVRRKKVTRKRKLAGMIKETIKLKPSYSRSKTWSNSKSKSLSVSSANSNIKQIVIDESDIDMDDGWGDDNDFVDGAKFARFGANKNGAPPNPPFEIGVCWKYEKIFLERKQKVTLAIWRPNVSDGYVKVSIDESKEECDEEREVYILGYLGLSCDINPNDNIPMLTVKKGSDKDALRAPKNFEMIQVQELHRKSPKNGQEQTVYRYWLRLVPEEGYVALGSIVIDRYLEPIDENLLAHNLKTYFFSHQQRKYLQIYALDRLMCVKKEYIQIFGNPLDSKRLLSSKRYKFTLHRAQPVIVSGVYKLVEMPCILRKDLTVKNDGINDFEFGQEVTTVTTKSDNDIRREKYTACVTQEIMDLCVKRLQYNIRIVGDSPLIISYATHFKLKWSSKRLTSTSNTKSAVWEPVLGPNEFMVGHIAFGDWNHPASHMNNCRLLIIKSGGSDPDAFKAPLGFECLWSVYKPGQKHTLGKSKGFGSGYVFGAVTNATGLTDDTPPPSGSFWRAIAPQGYTALGDIALPIDGEVRSVNKDGSKQKLGIDKLLRSHDVPKYVCIKDEYLSVVRELEVDEIKDQKDNVFENAKAKLQSTVLENKVRNRIWSSERVKRLSINAGIYEQEPVTRDILSPMFCKTGLKTPTSEELFPTLNIEFVIEALPYWKVVKAGKLRKKGEGFYAQSRDRYFVLTNEKLIYYFDEIQEKGTIQLSKMRTCGMCKGTNKQFYIHCSDRKWELEVINEQTSGGKAQEWVASIQYVQEGSIGGDDMSMSLEDSEQKSKSPKSQSGIIIEEKESEQEKIVKLLTKMLNRYAKLLKHTMTENETTESVESAVTWYEDLQNTRTAIDILLATWPRGTICPPGVVRARAQLKTLMEQTTDVVFLDIKSLSNENVSAFTILRLHKACCLMSDLDKGQKLVSEYITDTLLNSAATEFEAGGKYCDLANIDRRFNLFWRQMKVYDANYNQFIPKWWELPIKIGSRFCNLMGETLDDQLTRFPENSDAIRAAKIKCEKFEEELIENAMRRICSLELDVRSWCKWDAGDPVSYIKIDGNNVMIPGKGLCVVAIDILTKKVLKKKLFPMCKHSAHKNAVKHKKMLRNWLDYIDIIDDQTLIVMATHEHSGQLEFKKQLGINGLPKELKALQLTNADMISETNLFSNKGCFIFIGRKGGKDTYWTCLKKGKKEGPVMNRHIIAKRFIPKHRLNTLCDVDQIPFYTGIISQVLERHLDIFVGAEANNVHQILSRVFNNETMLKLEESKQWLSAINKMGLKQKSNACFESVENIANTMKQSIETCIEISNGKPLLDLLRKYGQLLQEYASILLKLLNEAGGHRLHNKLNLNAEDKEKLLKIATNDSSDDSKSKDVSPKKRGFSIFSNNLQNETWTESDIQFFVIYCCMVYNTCNKARELVTDLLIIGTKDIKQKYKNGCKSCLIETRELFLSIEEQCLQLIRACVIDKFESIFEFEKHSNWEIDNYRKELTTSFDLYLTNCSKLLPPSALEHFYKIFTAHFGLRLFERILHSNTLSSDESKGGHILIDFPPIIQTVIFKQIPPRIIKKMQIYINRCLNPVIKLIQLAYANAGDKYSKLETIKNENNNSKNILSRFFGGGNNKNKNKNESTDNDEKDSEIDMEKQMLTRQKTVIATTVFANKCVGFYTDGDIKLQILHNIPSYKELFADDEDETIQSINSALNALDRMDITVNINAAPDLNNESDSPLPAINDNDYFGNNPEKSEKTKSVSGFAVVKKSNSSKKKQKRKRPLLPSMTAPRMPLRNNNVSAPTKNNQKQKPSMNSFSVSNPIGNAARPLNKNDSSGLNVVSLNLKKEIKLTEKWDVIEKVMALRGFDVADQRTIRFLCEDAQEQIQLQK